MVQSGASKSLPPGVLVVGKYRIESELGRGGMGAVYLAHHEALDQKVAIKILFARAHTDVARFVREARSAARLQSEHVVRVTDVGAAPGVGPYMVMEYLRGSDFGRIIDEHGRMPVVDAVDAVLQAADALAEAHALGIVHRDLKPQNLFLARRVDGTTVVKVLDFGISKINELDEATPKLTETRSLIGSPHYMSPEQLRSAHDVDSRADIWSMGVVLYELLTAQTPFDGHTLGAVFAKVLESSPKSVRVLRPDVPPPVEAAITRCLERDPARRFQHIGELALALAPFGSGRENTSAERASSFATMADARAPSTSGVQTIPPGAAGPRSQGGASPWSPAAAPTLAEEPSTGRGAGKWLAAALAAVVTLAIVAGAAIGLRVHAKRGDAAPGAGGTAAPAYDDMAPPVTPTLTADPPTTGAPAIASSPPVASTVGSAVAPRPKASAHPAASGVSSGVVPSTAPDLDRRR